MLTASFPPVDKIINILSQIEYKKHFYNLINACIVFVAVSVAIVSFIYTNTTQWYKNGGKDLIQKTYAQVADLCVICYLWIRCEGYPELVRFADDVKQTYQNWQYLVTV
jgi:hypothetical protein